jgi:RNA polymerase sigma-70 factor (ECF subfamily)
MQSIGMKKLFRTSTTTTQPDPAHWAAKFADYLYSYALARLEDDHLCRDLVQDTFLAALEKLNDFKGQSSERTWLTAILKYKIIDVYRKKNAAWLTSLETHGSSPEFFEPDDGHWKDIWSPQPMAIDHGDPTIIKELAAVLRKCIDRLPPLWQSIFVLRHLEDSSTEAICQEFKLTPSNFWVIIHRAKVNLRACLQKEGL